MKLKTIVPFLAILIVLIAYPFLINGDGMMKQSVTDIIRLQKKKKMKEFFYKVGFVGNERVVLFVMILAYNSLPRMSALYIWTFTPLMMVLQAVLSGIYQQSRPFWQTNEI